MKPGSPALYDNALGALKALGYKYVRERPDLGGTCYDLDANGTEIAALIQIRSYVDNNRYTIGVMFDALKLVDYFVPWFQGEKCLYIIPSGFMLDIYETHKDRARFTGENQWRVDFFPLSNQLKVQGASDDRRCIREFSHAA